MAKHKNWESEDQFLTDWYYDNQRMGFVMKAQGDIMKGEEIYISYGNNMRDMDYFLTYGIVPDDSRCTDCVIKVKLRKEDVMINEKEKGLATNMRGQLLRFRVMIDLSEENTSYFMGMCRYIVLRPKEMKYMLKEIKTTRQNARKER
jgi:hypothetical protein